MIKFTEREKVITKLIFEGYSEKYIAKNYDVTVARIEQIKDRILSKMGANDYIIQDSFCLLLRYDVTEISKEDIL